jgi:hypothetical protein
MDLNYFYKPNSPLYEGLKKLFIKKDFFDDDMEQMKKLAKDCHDFWLNQVKSFKGSSIKYILIGEAPPFSEDDVAYVYNPASKNTQWQTRILNAFGIDEKSKEDAFAKLRDEGFLLIDLFPYPAKFGEVDHGQAYKELIDLSVEHYLPKLLHLLNDKLNKHVKVAFAMKRFGHHINRVLEKDDGVKGYDIFSKDKLSWKLENIAGKTYTNKDNTVLKRISCYENVIADQSGNPNSSLIRYSFKLN